MSQLVTRIDASRENITVSFLSINKDEMPDADEKILTNKLVQALGADDMVPIAGITGAKQTKAQS